MTAKTPKKTDSANALWGGRFAAGPSAIMARINASIDIDRRLYKQDIAGSRAHCRMLVDAGIIPAADGAAIRETLQGTDLEYHAEANLRMAVGCTVCEGLGYRGRVLAYEVLNLPSNEEVRIDLAHLLEQSNNAFYKAREMPGVLFQGRAKSVQLLMDAGVVDPISARRVLGA